MLVDAKQAQAQLKAVQSQLASLQKQTAAANKQLAALQKQQAAASKRSASMFDAGIPSLSRWGNQIQWAGRQLQYNFTLPILIAGGFATKFALDNERAMTKVKKVYGDGVRDADFYKQEIEALGGAFEALSTKYGVAQEATINIAAAWAAAGSSGVALAKSVDLTMQTMILGEMDAAQATEALIAIQAQYGYTVKELSAAIDVLNMTENQTGISMQGLITGFQRTAGVARTAGIDVKHLAAMMAALVPSAGTAANAGNSLKTIISRLLSPTKEAAQVMKAMNIHISDTAWQSMNGTKRLETFAHQYGKLNDAQKAVVASTIAGNWQFNRFTTLMTDINNPMGYYRKSLQATEVDSRNFHQKMTELNKVLDSNPQKLQQIWVALQNLLAGVIKPLLPAIISLAGSLTMVAQKFGDLSPEIQHLIIGLLLFLAAIGPVARYIGSVANLIGILKEAVLFLGRAFLKTGGLIKSVVVGPFKLLFEAFSGLRAGLGKVIGWVSTSFWGFLRSFGPRIMLGLVTPFRTAGPLAWAAIRVAFTGVIAGIAGGILRVGTIVRIGLSGVLAIFTNFGPAILIALRTLGGLLFTGWGAIIFAVLGIAYVFRDRIKQAWRDVVQWFSSSVPAVINAFAPVVRFFNLAVSKIEEAFWRLPAGVRDALLTVIKIVQIAAMKVYELFSYLNPWAHHSPSLVESVNSGMAAVKSAYASVGNVGAIFAKAARDLAVFKVVAAALKNLDFSNMQKTVASASPANGALFSALLSDLRALTPLMARQEAAVNAQQAVVDRWKTALDAANASLQAQELRATQLADTLQSLTDAYNAHQQAIQDFAQAPIAGMGAMSDAIFANEQAQKKLRLEMLQLGPALGGSVDDIRGRLSALDSDINALRNNASELRAAGAGSDILGPIEDQISAMEAQRKALEGAASGGGGQNALDQMQAQLDELQRQGEILQLQNDITFDPLIRNIEKLANSQKELSYQQIIDGITKEKAAMAALKPQIDAASRAVDTQNRIVAAATAARDALSKRYDTEVTKLDAVRAAYDKTAEAVRNIEAALQDMSTAADEAIQKMRQAAEARAKATKAGGAGAISPGLENFNAAAGAANFGDVGGGSKIGREFGLEDQKKLVDDFTRQVQQDISNMFSKFDMWKPIKDKWNQFVSWFQTNVGSQITAGLNNAKTAVSNFQWPTITSPFDPKNTSKWAEQARSIFATLQDIWNSATTAFSFAWFMIEPEITRIWNTIRAKISQAWGEIGPILEQFRGPLGELGNAFKGLWAVVKPLAIVLGGIFIGALKIVLSILAHTIGPVLNTVIGVVRGLLEILLGVVQFVVGTFAGAITGNFDMVREGVLNILKGLWDAAYAVVRGAWDILWGIIEGIATPLDFLGQFVNKALDNFVDDFLKPFGVAKGRAPEIIHETVQGIGHWISQIGPNVNTWLGNFAEQFTQPFRTVKENIGDEVRQAVMGIGPMIASIGPNVNTWLGNAVDQFTQPFRTIKENWGTEINQAITDVVGWIAGLGPAVNKILDQFAQDFLRPFKWVYDQLVGHSIIPDLVNEVVAWFAGLPQKAWNALRDFGTKITDRAHEAWDMFTKKSSEMWGSFTAWLGGLPGKAYGVLINIKDKLYAVAQWAWDNFFKKSLEGWGKILTWIAGLPLAAYTKFIAIKDRLFSIAQQAFDGFVAKAKSIIDGSGGFMSWIGGIPGRIAGVLGTVGSTVANAVKTAWNASAGWINDHGLSSVNSVLKKFNVPGIPNLPTFARGGIVPGTMTTRDSVLAALRPQEGVLVPEAVKAIGGARGLERLNREAERGQVKAKNTDIPGLAKGGMVGDGIGDWLQRGAGFALDKILAPFQAGVRAVIPGRPFMEDFMAGVIQKWRDGAKNWGQSQDSAMGTGNLGGMGYQRMEEILRNQFPGIVFTSDYRPGAITASGNQSYHALGRAVDMTPNMDYFNWIRATYGKNTKELIYTPAGNRQIKDGQDYVYGEPVAGMHYNHVHWAYDKGGILQPGMTAAYNGTGKDELVLTHGDAAAISNVLSMMDRMMSKSGSGATPGAATVARMSASVSSLEARLRANDKAKAEVVRGSGSSSTTIHINGDLVLPNIKSGDDADLFIKHLKTLAG